MKNPFNKGLNKYSICQPEYLAFTMSFIHRTRRRHSEKYVESLGLEIVTQRHKFTILQDFIALASHGRVKQRFKPRQGSNYVYIYALLLQSESSTGLLLQQYWQCVRYNSLQIVNTSYKCTKSYREGKHRLLVLQYNILR